jgi:hypothetical protein
MPDPQRIVTVILNAVKDPGQELNFWILRSVLNDMKKSHPNFLSILIGMTKRGKESGDASLAGGPFFQVVAMRRGSLIIQPAMTEVGWIFVVDYEDANKTWPVMKT